MARQDGYIRVTGVAEDVQHYLCDGLYYARMKSSLTGKDFWKGKAFEGSRKSCKRFGIGNKLASAVYKGLTKEKRVYALFCDLKTIAILRLKAGSTEEEVLKLLEREAKQHSYINPPRHKQRKPAKAFPYARSITANYIVLTMGRLEYLQNKYGEDKLDEMLESFFHCPKLYHPPPQQLQAIAAVA